MALPVESLMIDPGDDVHYSSAWTTVIEAHLRYLINHPSTVKINVDPQAAYKYEFDLWGLLTSLNYPMYLHRIVMRMNDMVSPTDFTADHRTLLIPAQETIASIRNVFATTYTG